MNSSAWLLIVPYLKLALWAVNALVYGYAIRLYLRPVNDQQRPVCALCGSRSDVFCMGLQPAMSPMAIPQQPATTTAGYAVTAGRIG